MGVPEPPGHVARGRGDGGRFAKFELVSPAATVTVRAADLAGDLYRVTTPAGGGVRPVVGSRGGLVRAALRPTGAAGPDAVEITLHAGVRWALLLRAGAGEVLLDLAAAALTGVAVVGGAGRLRLFLPRPAAVAGRVWLAAGIGRAEVWAPPGVPVVVRGAARAARPGLGGPGYVVEARSALGELLLH
ncbi:hypothetical protein [Spirilliplanes yamanashiensis]|uniref:hypothetical protein n=1 Tax=Spirilliplanes yamanashiensis TaxID=42233 RepID=UPI0031E32884